jgi:hypothetical protein
MQSEAGRIQATVADLTAVTADCLCIADVAASTWREIHAVLSPVIGSGGVAALYQRALHLTRTVHPALAAVREDVNRPGEYAALQLMLSQQTSEQIAAINAALLQTFCDLLENLIGISLTERLLQSVHDLPAGSPAPQRELP